MLDKKAEWRPGSFTKNFSWGSQIDGLKNLHEAIRVGFDGKLNPVTREEFRSRISSLSRPDFIPMNFFLLNSVENQESLLIVDELVYQAVSASHSSDFDKLALTAFNVSYVGRWKGAPSWQAFPSVWAYFYLTEHTASRPWISEDFSANSIEEYVGADERYLGETSRKLSTNLAYMYRLGRMFEITGDTLDRWWTSAVFLTLDRSVAEDPQLQKNLSINDLHDSLKQQKLLELTGSFGPNRKHSLIPLCKLYSACGGLQRWSPASVEERQRVMLPHLNWFTDSLEMTYAVYPEDPNLIKTIPQACAMLAKNLASFEEIDPTDFAAFNVVDYVRNKTREALDHLKALRVKSTMSAEDLLKLTRG